MERLLLNDQECDLSPDTVIAITFQVNEIGEIKDRQSNFSNQFKLPPTAKNLRIIQNCDMIQPTTNYPYRKAKAVVIKKGMQVVPNGYAIIESVDAFINVTVYSGNIEFFNLIEGLTMSDLDLSAWDHEWMFDVIIASFPNTDGYKYPIINYGKLTNAAREITPSDDMRTAAFYKTVVDQMFVDRAWNKSGNIFSNPGYQKLLVPSVETKMKHSQRWINAREFKAHISPSSISGGIATDFYNCGMDDISSTGFYDRDTLITLGGWNTAGPALAYMTMRELGGFDFTTSLTFTISGWTDGLSSFKIVDGLAATVYNHPNTVFGGGNGTFTVTVSYKEVSGPSGSPIMIHNPLVAILQCDADIADGYWLGKPTEDVLYYQMTLASERGSTINLETAISPDMLQKDFFKAFLQKFGVIIKTDTATKTLVCKQFKEIAADISKAVDWSNKLHMDTRTWKLEYRLGTYARKNWLRYKEDSNDNDIIKNSGDGYFTIDDDTLELEKTLLTLPFAATKMDRLLVNLDVPTIRKYDADGNFTIDNEPRLLIDDTQDIDHGDMRFNDPLSFGYLDLNTDIPLCYFQLASKTFNAGFDDSLIEDNYADYADALDRLKKFTGLFNLTELDIERLDFFVPVYLKQFAAYFYINKIPGYTGVGLTRVELVRLLTSENNDITDNTTLLNVELEEDGTVSLQEDGMPSLRE